MMRGIRSRHGWWDRRRTIRRGAAVVETAVVAPLLLTMMFGVMEFGWVFMVQQSLTNAVREACRTGALPGATDNDITQRFVGAMQGAGVQVTTQMVTITHATQGDPILTVRASMPYSQVSLLGTVPWWSNEGKNIGAVCSMRKEGV